MPVGFKNTTSGAVTPALNAIKAAMQPQTFLGIDEQGRASVVATEGNPDSHVILRGGDDAPNYDAASVAHTLELLQKHGLPRVVMIDASHANCGKKCSSMPATFREILAQRSAGQRGIIGAMLESNLVAGAQALTDGKDLLEYGKSITDQCIDWPMTEVLVREIAG
jgi:3-deoxy-7-phosphoheptulonate synthase